MMMVNVINDDIINNFNDDDNIFKLGYIFNIYLTFLTLIFNGYV